VLFVEVQNVHFVNLFVGYLLLVFFTVIDQCILFVPSVAANECCNVDTDSLKSSHSTPAVAMPTGTGVSCNDLVIAINLSNIPVTKMTQG
jgi:hypothetical protein